jgi:hypothetical protein
MKYGSELSSRWYCGTWFERIDDENIEGDLADLPVSTTSAGVKQSARARLYINSSFHFEIKNVCRCREVLVGFMSSLRS